MEKTKEQLIKETVDEFLTPDENEVKKDISTEEENICTTEECKMKNRSGLVERVDKKYVTSDGRQLLVD